MNKSMKLDELHGLAVDPLRGYLFWADWGITHISVLLLWMERNRDTLWWMDMCG